jgi:cold shock protein
MPIGTVQCYTGKFGFISPDDGSPDLFYHARDVIRAGHHILLEGQRISFDVRENKNKPGRFMAINLQLLPPILHEANADDGYAQIAHMPMFQSNR